MAQCTHIIRMAQRQINTEDRKTVALLLLVAIFKWCSHCGSFMAYNFNPSYIQRTENWPVHKRLEQHYLE